MFDRILVATDFSACARAAFERALALAARMQATLDVVYVRELGPVDEARARLAAFVARGDARGVPVRCLVESGRPAEALVRMARHYDLLVVGTHGRHGLGRLVLGSTAEAVVRDAPCPVVTVHARAVETPDAADVDPY